MTHALMSQRDLRGEVRSLNHFYSRQFSANPVCFWPAGWDELVHTVCRLVDEMAADVKWMMIVQTDHGLRMRRQQSLDRSHVKSFIPPGLAYDASASKTPLAIVDNVILAAELESRRRCVVCSRPGGQHQRGSRRVTLCLSCAPVVGYQLSSG